MRDLLLLLFLSSFLASAHSFECEAEGVVADPEDCRAFYVCDSYHAEHYICGDSLLFDEEFLVCNFDYVVLQLFSLVSPVSGLRLLYLCFSKESSW